MKSNILTNLQIHSLKNVKDILVTLLKNFRKFSAEFSDFRISENFRKTDITDMTTQKISTAAYGEHKSRLILTSSSATDYW